MDATEPKLWFRIGIGRVESLNPSVKGIRSIVELRSLKLPKLEDHTHLRLGPAPVGVTSIFHALIMQENSDEPNPVVTSILPYHRWF